MFRLFVFLFVLFLPLTVFAKSGVINSLDVNLINSDNAKVENKTKEVDKRNFHEKLREKFHLPKSKKIYLHNIDNSDQPLTIDDYDKMTVEKLRKDFEIPTPKFETEEKEFILPNPKYRVTKYNLPAGQRSINISQVVKKNSVKSAGILSPDKTRMIYTEAVFIPEFFQVCSSVYLVPVDSSKNVYDLLMETNVSQQIFTPIFSVGTDEIRRNEFRTLAPIDWNEDGNKIAFKEKIGSNFDDTWQTNIIVYDFDTKTWIRLMAVREAIIYWWRENKQINLKKYRWDIIPIGWEKNNPDRIVLYAYAYTDSNPLFLGIWSIDSKEKKSKLISINSTGVEISLNGLGLKEVKLEN